MQKFLLLWLTANLFLAAFLVGQGGVMGQSQEGQSQDVYSLQLQGFMWAKTTLNVLVVAASNESWWSNRYDEIVSNAVGQWNDSIAAFAQNHSEYSYMSSFRIQATFSNVTLPGFDIYINWVKSPSGDKIDEVGLSLITTTYQGTISNSTIKLATHSAHGEELVEGDMQNIAIHEIGHSLGLGHSNYTGDVMYFSYSIGSPADFVSTLDAYGVATLFSWELNPPNFRPYYGWLKVNSVVLPDSIPYQELPVSAENARPQTIENNPVFQFLVLMLGILIHPEIFTVVIVFIVVFAIVALFPRKRKTEKLAMAES